MILLCGIPSETPLGLVAAELERHDADVVFFNQREFDSIELAFAVEDGRVSGQLKTPDACVALEDISGVYVRLMDDRALPELDGEPDGSPARLACRALHDTLCQWFEIAPGVVLNRYGPMGSNGSKPYQAQLITRHGFRTPETLVTNDPEEVIAFRREHGRIIYKSASGARSIVTELEDEDLSRLDALATCPTQFQQCVDGWNLRVHVVGSSVFATAIEAEGLDYRYSGSTTGSHAELRAVEIPDSIAEACVELSADLGLGFSGIDLMIDGEGEVYCLEANPSPAFSYYELGTGQPIASAVAELLMSA